MDYGQRLTHLVDAAAQGMYAEDGLRTHLGASVVGDKCMRAVWYGFRWAERELFEGRMLRLFAHGQREEEVFVELLRKAGAKVWTHDAEKRQFRISGLGGHFGGSMDGVARELPGLPSHIPKETPILLELKTHNDKSFKDLLSKGLVASKPRHFKQAQSYMHLSGLKFCLYCAVNKNDEALWFYLFEYDPAVGTSLLLRAETVVFGEGLPPRISETPAWFECRFCAFKDICHAKTPPRINCRTCAFSRPERDGSWSCSKGQTEITDKPKEGCEQYQLSHAFR